MILLLTSTPGTETERILKEISSQITEIEDTEKKIEDINNFLDEIPKKALEQKTEALKKLSGGFNKKHKELLISGLGKIKEQPKLGDYDIIKNFIQTLKTDYKNNKEEAIEKLNKIVFQLDGNNNTTMATSKEKLQKLILNLNSEKKPVKQESIIDKIITEFNNLIQ